VRLLLFCLSLWVTLSGTASGDPWASPVLRLIDHSVNETFDEAHTIADSLLVAHPDRPEPPFYKATVLWRQGLNVRDGKKYDDQILAYLALSIERTEEQVRRHGDTAEMFLWFGNAYGLRTGLRMLRKEVFQGVVDGIEGRQYLDEAILMDPNLVDANFGIGLSDYILSRNPTILRAVQRLFSLPSGDRRSGIERLEIAIAEGHYNRIDALSARAYLDLYYEMDAIAARRRLVDLLNRYPNSLDYRIRYADTMLRLQMEHGEDLAQAMIDSTASIRRIAYQRKWQLFRWRELKLTFIQGVGHFLLGNRARARALLTAVAAHSRDNNNWLVGPAELILGKLADLTADRATAKEHYRRSERRDDVWGSHDEAKRFQIQAYTGQEPAGRPVDDEIRYPGRP